MCKDLLDSNKKIQKSKDPISVFSVKQEETEKIRERDPGVAPTALYTTTQLQQENINTLREMEHGTENIELHRSENQMPVESAGQLQKGGRFSGLNKAQRKALASRLQNHDRIREEQLFQKEVVKRETLHDVVRAGYLQDLSMELRNGKVREREDVTGHERRQHAKHNVSWNTALNSTMEKDLDRLVYNMQYDIMLDGNLEVDARVQRYQDAGAFLKDLEERNRILVLQERAVEKREKDPTYWDEKVPVTQETTLELKKKYFMNSNLQLFLKNASQNNTVNYEVNRAKLQGMQMAKRQLEEDLQMQPSAYTRKLIEKIDQRIEDQQAMVNQLYDRITKPASKENVRAVKRSNIYNGQIVKLAKVGAKLREHPGDEEVKRQAYEEMQRLIAGFKSPLSQEQEEKLQEMQIKKEKEKEEEKAGSGNTN